MSWIKQQIDENENLLRIAQSILNKIGIIKECDIHGGTFIDHSDNFDEKEIYDLATAEYERDFPNTKDITDFKSAIKEAIRLSGEECHSCRKIEEA